MRRLLVPFGLFIALVSSAMADVTFVHVWPQWRGAEEFDRIRTYFGGPVDSPRETIVRTQPDSLEGLYFLVRVKSDHAVGHGRFVLDLIRPDSPDVKRYTFEVSLPAKSQVAELGLTGTDWSGGPDVHPVAWKVTLLDREGTPLASEHSFLWEKPAK